jgi:hypothetical protein
MMSSVHEANIKGFPAVVERIESHLTEGANTDEELVKLATDILRLRDRSLGDVSEWSHSLSSSGTANHGKLVNSKIHKMSAVSEQLFNTHDLDFGYCLNIKCISACDRLQEWPSHFAVLMSCW